jgi:branched-chain amino acid transport system permease protein
MAFVLQQLINALALGSIYRPLRGAPDVSLLLTSLGVSMFLQNSAIMAFGGQSKAFAGPAFLDQRLPVMQNVGVATIDVVIFGDAMRHWLVVPS